MNSKIYLFIPLIIAITSCSSKVELDKSEFDILCHQFTQLTLATDFSQLNSQGRAEKLDQMLLSKLSSSGNTYAAWSAVQNLFPSSERYNVLRESAKSVGYQDWNCPAIKLHGHEVGS